jgi:hypothetical protein
MSLFIFALLAGLLLHQIISIIQPIAGSRTYRVGRRIVIELPEKTYLIAKVSGFVLAILLFLLVVLLILAQSLHPAEGYAYRFADALTSPRMGSAVFGGLVGLLLGNLLNRILSKNDDYTFTSSDRFEILLIFLLVILGIGGEEWLRSQAQRINKISVGTTTEISFSDVAPKSSRASAEQPSGAFRNTQGDSGGSAGLEKLYDIGSVNKSNISRDRQFIEVLARYEREPKPDPADNGLLAKQVLSPMASCFSGIYKLNGDLTFIQQQLTLLIEPLRKLAEPKYEASDKDEIAADTLEGLKKTLNDTIRKVAIYAKPKLAAIPGGERYSCKEITSETSVNTDAMSAFRREKDDLPYAAMAYASVMAALQHYEAAVITLGDWIKTAQERLDKAEQDRLAKAIKKNVAAKWYLLRARLTQALFLNEWIRQRGPAASSWLRKYHIDNLKAIADGIGSFAAISEVSRKNNDYKWTVGLLGASHSGDEGRCDIPVFPTRDKDDPERPADAGEREILQTIFDTYLSARKDYVDQSLKHPIMKVRSAALIGSEVKSLMPLSLRCIRNDISITRAEHIERYVRSEINLLNNLSALKSKDEARARVRDLNQLLSLAFQLIEPEAAKAREGKDKGQILDRIETDWVLEVYETLLATQEQLQTFSEREILN